MIDQDADSAGSRQAAQAVRRMVCQNIARWRRWALVEALGLIVALPLAYFWLALLADNLLHLGRLGRLGLAAGFLALAGGLIWTRVRRWWALHLSEDEVALAIERRTPQGVQNRLINALQLARETPGGDARISDAVVRENYARLQQLRLPSALRPTAALVCVALALGVVALGWLLSSLHGVQFFTSARRLLLPLAAIEPVYRTTLEVLPGDLKTTGEATISIRIHGERPGRLTIRRHQGGAQTSETVAVPTPTDEVAYTFRSLRESLTYEVSANDFVSPTYRVIVDAPAELSLVRATFTYPAYTKWPARQLQSNSGDLEALIGTRAEVAFVLDRPAAEATLLLHQSATTAAVNRVSLTQVDDTTFRTALLFQNVSGYQLETRVADGAPRAGRLRALRVLADADPKLELLGLNGETEVDVDAVLALKVIATDDIGLAKVGLFARRLSAGGGDSAVADTNTWVALQAWPVNGAAQFSQDCSVAVAALGAVEGERCELQLRAVDVDPLKHDAWVSAPAQALLVGGEGTRLQLVYERLLQTERDLAGLVAAQSQAQARAAEWLGKLDPSAGWRWDDPKTLATFAAEMKEQAKAQEKIRQTAGAVARAMAAPAGDLRLSVGLLTDTEIVHAIQILEAVPGRDDPQAKRAALGDARLTQTRVVRSLQDISAQYQLVRQDWELANMIPFTKMLADRQQRLQAQSGQHAQAAVPLAATLGDSVARRQRKLLELAGLASAAFRGLGQRSAAADSVLGQAFTAAAAGLAAPELKTAMQQAADLSQARSWAAAGARQAVAAKVLGDIYATLKQTQTDLAKAALAALKEKAKGSVEAQRELERLKAGTAENFTVIPENLNAKDVMHMREVAKAANASTNAVALATSDREFREEWRSQLQGKDTGARLTLDMLSLPKTASSSSVRTPHMSDLPANRVTPVTQPEYDDLMGKLLKEAELNEKEFDTLSMTAGMLPTDAGDVGKRGGDFSSTAAVAATGNMKPPPHNPGGISRTGRQGARSFGKVLDDEARNMRGRDKVQEGQERAPDQAGVLHERDSDDAQPDASTGLGGKKVQRADANSFNTSDAGKFNPDTVDKMGPAREKAFIVERQDERAAANIDKLLRDLNSRQEQVVERLKAIRKELKNLYLPTDSIDELLTELPASLARLTEAPDPETFRQHQEVLDKLRNTVRVFAAAQTGVEPSLPREQEVRGPVLDEAARQPIPGYEEVVKTYYEMLAPLGAARTEDRTP